MLKYVVAGMLLALPIGSAVAAPIFDFSGRISDGELYAVELCDNGLVTLTSPNCDVWTFACLVTANGKRVTLGELANGKLRIEEQSNRAVFRGVCDAGTEKVAVDFELSLNGTDILLGATESSQGKAVRLEIAAVQDAAKLAEKDVQAGGEVLGFEAADSQVAGDLKPVVFCPEVPPRKLALEPQIGASQALLSGEQIAGVGKSSGLVLAAKDGRARLHIRKNTQVEANHSPDTYGGVDFWKHNQLKMPNYNLSRNLIQNPGFEEGFKYWTYGPLGVTTDMSQGEFFAISQEAPYSGTRCLQIRGDQRQDPPRLATFAIPIEKNQTYTISFYAKAKEAVPLGIFVQYERWGGDLFHWKSVPVTTEWKRHSVSFTSRFTCTSFALGLGKRDGLVWVDNVQFEKGPMTAFTQKEAGVCLVTAERGNLVEPGTGKDSFFRLSGKPGAELDLTYKVEDIFGKVRFNGKSAVALDNRGTATVAVDWVPKLPVGIYSIEINLAAGGQHLFREFDRVCVMKSAAKTPTKYPVFFADNLTSRNANWQRQLERSKYFGLDTVLNFKIPDYEADKDGFKKAVKAAGLYHVGCLSSDGYDTSAIKEPTATVKLADLEEHGYQIAKKHAGITAWKTINEPHTLANEDDMKTMVDYVAALSKGAKRFNPDNLVITPDPANMYPKAGINYIDLFLKYGGGEYCDIIGIHPYRGRPEEPDLDGDIAAMIGMLDRHNVKKDIWFTEGIYHNNYVLPSYKLDSHRGCSSDHFRTGDFSYHIGWGEKIAFAYTMRSWIITLKYGDRVKMSVDWVFGRYSALDHELTPTVKAFAPNTLKHLLCMADYQNDLGFGREVRGYMFQDDQKRPIAAIWTYNFLIDSGEEKGLELNIASLPRDIEILDCFGATIQRPANNLITLSSFPVFVRGSAKSLAKLNAAFKETTIVSKNFKQTFMSVNATELNEREFTLKNMQPYRAISGQLKLTVDGRPVFSDKIQVAGGQAWQKSFSIGARKGKVQMAEIQAEFTDTEGGKPEVFSTSSESLAAIKATKPIAIDGDLADWPRDSMVQLEPRFKSFMPYLSDQKKKRELTEKYPQGIPWKGEGDLSAKLLLAWDADNLYIAFDVTDDKLETADQLASAWMGDSIQLYFDCWADAAGKYTRGFDINDQVFDLWPHDNQAVLRRAFAPEQQLGFLKTGVVEKAKTAFKKTPAGYVVEMAIPAHDIFPVKLFKGSVFGFAAIVNDRDVGFRHQGLVTTPQGTEPYPNPHLYPTVILK